MTGLICIKKYFSSLAVYVYNLNKFLFREEDIMTAPVGKYVILFTFRPHFVLL
jgi:hypothetical protein